jgi:hypothetical protein
MSTCQILPNFHINLNMNKLGIMLVHLQQRKYKKGGIKYTSFPLGLCNSLVPFANFMHKYEEFANISSCGQRCSRLYQLM